jgi:hypothetical protein
MKIMMNHEFQHFVESQLIELMNVKMHRIQFVLIVNLIRMQSNEIAKAADTIPDSMDREKEKINHVIDHLPPPHTHLSSATRPALQI